MLELWLGRQVQSIREITDHPSTVSRNTDHIYLKRDSSPQGNSKMNVLTLNSVLTSILQGKGLTQMLKNCVTWICLHSLVMWGLQEKRLLYGWTILQSTSKLHIFGRPTLQRSTACLVPESGWWQVTLMQFSSIHCMRLCTKQDQLQRLSIFSDSCLETLGSAPALIYGLSMFLSRSKIHLPNLFLKPNQIKGQLQPQTSPRISISLFTFYQSQKSHSNQNLIAFFLNPKWKWSICKYRITA